MKITDFDAIPIRIPLSRPNVTATGVITESRKVIVKIMTDAGITGFGEASCVPEYGGATADTVIAVMARYRDALIGADPANLVLIGEKLRQRAPDDRVARAAVDVALHDIAARNADEPVYALFNGRTRNTVEMFAIVTGEGPDEIAEDARLAQTDGYRVVKVKAGFEPIEATIAKIEAIRNALGDDLAITVDANQAWCADEAIANIKRMEPLGIQSVEQPTAAKNIEGMAIITASCDVDIIADESVWDLADALMVIRAGAADVLSVRVAKAGGLSGARAILEAAREAGMPCILGSMLETDLGISAALQLAASTECELHASALFHYRMLVGSLLERPLCREGATLRVPAGPGMGGRVSDDALDEFREYL